jgi:hypothetical protein
MASGSGEPARSARSREYPGIDASCTGLPKGLRKRINRGTARHYVIHDRNPLIYKTARNGEGAPHVFLTELAGEAGLGHGGARTMDAGRLHRKTEPAGERSSKLEGLVVPALAQSFPVQGNRNEEIHVRHCAGKVVHQLPRQYLEPIEPPVVFAALD